jgi:hypothetical protein
VPRAKGLFTRNINLVLYNTKFGHIYDTKFGHTYDTKFGRTTQTEWALFKSYGTNLVVKHKIFGFTHTNLVA